MEIIAEKTTLMTNKASGINKEVKLNRQKFETVKSFKYLGSVVSDDGCIPEIAQTTVELTRLKPVWNEQEHFS